MKTILIVEDDHFFREAISDLLKKKSYAVLQAPNGKIAKDIMMMQELDLVLTDIQMPGFSGVDLLEWSKIHKPIPFIMMTGFSMLLETKSAYEMGAKEFLTKPFKNIDLIAAIDKVTGRKEFQVTESGPQVFCKVGIDEFVARPQVEFDIYVQLNDARYIKIAHAGEELPTGRVLHYREKGIKYLYIQKEDFGKIVDFNIKLTHLMKDREEISETKKLNFLRYTSEVILEKVFVDGVDKKTFFDAHNFMDLVTDTVTKSPECFDMVNLLNNHSNRTYAQSLGVAMYAVMIAKKMGYESNQTLFKLGMAGIFHDIGKKEVDPSLLDKPRHLLTNDERKAIESHVPRGKDILLASQLVPEEVIQIVYEHHEDCAGQGYPMARTASRLHPLSKIIQGANVFIEHMMDPHMKQPDAMTAIKYIERTYQGRIDRKVMIALKELFTPAA